MKYFDVVIYQDKVRILNQKNFEGLFKESDVVLAKTAEWADKLSKSLPIDAAGAGWLAKRLRETSVMRRRVQSILKSQYLFTLTIDTLRIAMIARGLDPDKLIDGGSLALIKETECDLLLFLNEDLWTGDFSGEQYCMRRPGRRGDDGRHIPVGIEAVRDRTIMPYDLDPVPDALAIFPYRIEEPLPGRIQRRARVLSPQEIATLYPNTLQYLTAKKARLDKRDVSPDPGEAFWAYGRSQSLTLLDEPKLIARVLSVAPRYGADTKGLLVPGGGDGGPYYLLRPRPGCPYPIQIVLALLCHPAVDAFVASRGKAYRGSYVVHRKRFLTDVPVPALGPQAQIAIKNMVDEIQSIVVRLRTEADSSIRTTLAGRMDILREHVEALITAGYGLASDDIDALVG